MLVNIDCNLYWFLHFNSPKARVYTQASPVKCFLRIFFILTHYLFRRYNNNLLILKDLIIAVNF